ncbi:hypothetical protein AB0R12_10900, partial [Streptomyces niveus]|uniref:hypothetical protein n=1 Tax=Streptomyces niveus TaxID=193462 RepID=UPI003440644A
LRTGWKAVVTVVLSLAAIGAMGLWDRSLDTLTAAHESSTARRSRPVPNGSAPSAVVTLTL